MRHLLSGRRDSGHPTSSDRLAPRHVGAGRGHGAGPRQIDRRLGYVDRRRAIGKVASLAAVLVFAVAGSPGAALASSLLSGYGGPGEGSEAILGSTLVNGPSGGAGAGPSGGAGAGAAGAAGSASASALSGTARSGRGSAGASHDERTGLSSAGSTAARGTGGPAGRANGPGDAASVTRTGSAGTAFAVQAADRGSIESEDLGLTAKYLVYVLLVLAGLAAVWALTIRFARTGVGGAFPDAKGTAQGTRLKP